MDTARNQGQETVAQVKIIVKIVTTVWIQIHIRQKKFPLGSSYTKLETTEPDFFAGAEAGEKEPAPACCYVI